MNLIRKRLSLHHQRGLTLIELLTALVLFAMIMTILYSFLFMGISMYKRVAAEAQLRSQVNVFYSQFLEYIDGAIYAYQGNQANEIIIIKKEPVTAGEESDATYIKYYAIRLDSDAEQIRMTPVTGSGQADRDTGQLKEHKLDETFFDLANESTLIIEQEEERQQLVVDWTFQVRKAFDRNQEAPSIQIRSEIPIYDAE